MSDDRITVVDPEFGDREHTYTRPDAVQFVKDMQAAGLEVSHYKGRGFYEGPSVRVDRLQQAMQHTTVEVNYDNMGLGYVVHPAQRDDGKPKDNILSLEMPDGGHAMWKLTDKQTDKLTEIFGQPDSQRV